MFTFKTVKRVRYGETDRMGILYHGHYPLYYEIGRVEAMRSLGITYRAMEDEYRVLMPVVSLEIRYLRPARYDELIEINTTIRKMPGNEIYFHMELINERQTLINSGKVRLVFLEAEHRNRIECPPVLVDALKPYFG